MEESKDQERRRRKAAAAKRYNVTHAEQVAETKRRWRERNREHRKTYQTQWREKNREHHLESKREYERRKVAKERAEVERRAKKAAYARERYHADVQASRAKARAYLAARKAADPEGYRADKKRRNDAWRKAHKGEIDARRRERYRLDPAQKRNAAARYYQQHAEERKAYRRRYYQQHREQELAKQRQWRQREQRRIQAGLPVRRLHRVTATERQVNARAADAYFARTVTPQLKDRLLAELRTPPELIAAWERECARLRATQYALRNPETGVRVLNRNQAEQERMDTIARAINDRLRTTPRAARDPAAYTPPTPAVSSGGPSL